MNQKIGKIGYGSQVQMTAFHGYGQTNPEKITLGDEGFDLRYSKRAIYGKANYFSAKPESCKTYQHYDQTSLTYSVMQALILTANFYATNHQLQGIKVPPSLNYSQGGDAEKNFQTKLKEELKIWAKKEYDLILDQNEPNTQRPRMDQIHVHFKSLKNCQLSMEEICGISPKKRAVIYAKL